MVLPGDSSRHRQFHDSMIRRYSGIYRQLKYKIFTAQGRRETLNIYFKRLESKSNNSPARITKLAKMIAHWRADRIPRIHPDTPVQCTMHISRIPFCCGEQYWTRISKPPTQSSSHPHGKECITYHEHPTSQFCSVSLFCSPN